MATLAHFDPVVVKDERFFVVTAILMTLALVAGFSVQLGAGRSSFAAPLYVHVHAVLFFGWTMLYLLQNLLAGAGSLALHRRLGWLAVAWMPAMVAMGAYVTVALVRAGRVPFFFTPLYFLVMDVLTVLGFAGLTTAAIVLRRRTLWHRRLMLCGMAMLTAPGFGRLLPMPLLGVYAGWAVFAVTLLFPIAGVIRDLRAQGRVHPAWAWGFGVMVTAQLLTALLPHSPLGPPLYRAVTAGSPGAAIPANDYPPFPG